MGDALLFVGETFSEFVEVDLLVTEIVLLK